MDRWQTNRLGAHIQATTPQTRAYIAKGFRDSQEYRRQILARMERCAESQRQALEDRRC